MHKERRNGLEGFHFFCLEKTGRKLKVQEARSDLISNAFEQIKLLLTEMNIIDAVTESDQTEELTICDERNTNTVPAFLERNGKSIPEMVRPRLRSAIKVKRNGI